MLLKLSLFLTFEFENNEKIVDYMVEKIGIKNNYGKIVMERKNNE